MLLDNLQFISWLENRAKMDIDQELWNKMKQKNKLLFMIIYENIKQLESVGQLSANSLVNADCLEAMKYIADKSIDCIIADLPYG